jgi:BirA family transcriptional regulator, biotin operon repressor / biotin---[acetyl-CoA-carboxylase] ligase
MRVIRVATTPSTQDLARNLPVGSVVMADEQTSGRGRLGRRWEAPPGSALLASFVLPAHPLASLAAGVAAAAACGEPVRLKWPNDLLIEGLKVGGILVERRGERCVVGVGVNLSWAPPGGAQLEADRDPLLERLAGELERWFKAPEPAVLDAWRAGTDTLGRRVRVDLAGESFEGMAESLAEDGSLIVSGRPISAGDVIHLRDAVSPEGSLPTVP